MTRATRWRLNPTDEMLHRAAIELGSSRIVQVLWRLPGPVPVTELRAEWRRLDRGLLSRTAVPGTVPAARSRWVMASNTHALAIDRTPLTPDTALAWADTQVLTPLPAGSTRLWRLAAAPCADGCLVSLTVPHFRSDGLGILRAIAARTPARPPHDSDLTDALGQTVRALTRTAPWLLRLPHRRRLDILRTLAQPSPPARTPGPASRPRYFSTAVVTVQADAWRAAARHRHGTDNTLLLEIAANLVRTHVPRTARQDVQVGVPMSLRDSPRDEQANALVVVPLSLPGGAANHEDLQPTRQATKALLRRSGAHSATLVPEALWHLLPARAAAALKAPGAQQTDVVASNFGHPDDGVTTFAGRTADSLALRTMNVPGLLPDRARLRASLCLVQSGGRMTVTVTGMPDHFGDSARLNRCVSEEFAAWGIPVQSWWSPAPHPVQKG
ncbi:hypothetical protein [Streptomyces beigongshangae]|uniref:hypothetical protein n=1 Tax=Streptomyces beigongshangae TaxID=2841597 RepID=UPI001C854CFF|nr:hypothetical protein [Streptomyces sp. REN17]